MGGGLMQGMRKSDWGDFGALLLSAVAAAVAPLQVFLFAYIFLGPIHYLTEMAWLRKKEFYFREGLVSARVYMILAIGTAGMVLLQLLTKRDLSFWMIAPLLLVSLSVWLRNNYALLAVALVGLAMAMLVRTWVYFIAVITPTLVHVFFFTWVFMISGALRKSVAGWMKWVNPALVVVLPLGLLGLNRHYAQPGNFWLQSESVSFAGMHKHLLGDLHRTMTVNATLLDNRWVAALLRVFAFAYLFHYLNWFAKTELLQWHKISARTWAVVGVMYCSAIGVYMWNIKVGFVVVNFLGMMHVLLEFPLNWHTLRFVTGRMRGVHGETKPAPVEATV
jgi:hypothetical protein